MKPTSSDPAKQSLNGGVIRLGLLGAGTVGSALVGLLRERAEAITARTGITLLVTRIAVSSLTKDRPGIDAALLTDDASTVVKIGRAHV